MKQISKLEDLKSYTFLTKIMPSPLNLMQSSDMRNELYIALLKYITDKYREVWKPVKYYKDSIIKQLVNEVVPYYEGIFGMKIPRDIEIKMLPRGMMRSGVYQATASSPEKVTKYVKMTSKKLGNLTIYLEKFKTGRGTYQIPFFKFTKPRILIPEDQPLWVSVMTIPHELFHAFMFSTTYFPPWSYQTVLHEFSTSEYCAEVMGAKFLSEEYGLKLIFGEPLGSYEYTLYKLDYLLDKKDSINFIKNIITKEYVYDNEVFFRLNIKNLVRISKAWRWLYSMAVTKGSFFKYTPLHHVVKTDYGIIYNLLNPEKIKELYSEILNDEQADFYKIFMDIDEFEYKPYGVVTDKFRLLLMFSEKINELLFHYISPLRELSDEDIELILKFTKFGNPDPRKNPEYYKNRFRVKGLFEYFAYEPAVKKKALKYKDFWHDPRDVI